VLLMSEVTEHSYLLLPTMFLYRLSNYQITVSEPFSVVAAANIWNAMLGNVVSASGGFKGGRWGGGPPIGSFFPKATFFHVKSL